MKPIYKSLNLLTIDQILTPELQTFGHKLYHNNLPTPISKGMEKLAIHQVDGKLIDMAPH